MSDLIEREDYHSLLLELKSKIHQSQIRAALAVNKELVLLYWQIGNSILIKQEKEGWGSKIIEQLAKDLKSEFPLMKGFSVRNLKYMRSFAENYRDLEFVQVVLAQITWYHNITLLDKVKDSTERNFYIQESIKNGWSRNVMVHQIESNLYKRQIQAEKVHNFQETLSKPQSDLAHEILKDPYNFDFLSLGEEIKEKDLESALIKHITKFLLELGAGFAFIGKQYHVEVAGQDFYIDLLFYHIKLRAYVVIELKAGDFKPEYAGKLNFYLSAVDKILKSDDDKPSIGIILCKSKSKIIAEYALRDITKPIGVSEYMLTESIPENFKGELPSIEDLEKSLSDYQIITKEQDE
ncbi:MAG: PDDEXK nuclease domain-containing protein [Vampirovibrionia bacterium]|jgi:predicted nuclease of restriction endonuclease-like (RecB) superfamily